VGELESKRFAGEASRDYDYTGRTFDQTYDLVLPVLADILSHGTFRRQVVSGVTEASEGPDTRLDHGFDKTLKSEKQIARLETKAVRDTLKDRLATPADIFGEKFGFTVERP
jgi:hypothetical protein